MVEHPAGYKAPPRPGKLDAGVVVAFDEIQLSRHPGSIGFGAAVPRPARLHAYASPIPFLASAQGLLPAWAGSPLAGRVSHPLDGTQSFMEASPPPIPFDQQSLVALHFLSAILIVSAGGMAWSLCTSLTDSPLSYSGMLPSRRSALHGHVRCGNCCEHWASQPRSSA